jgi:N-acetylmuramoyl-L-alanine amidase
MRNTGVARRALLALAGGIALGGWQIRRGGAQPARRHPGLQVKPRPRRLHVVALDPGHGGLDPGAISPRGIFEKNITLATARQLARQLEATGRYRPVLTRGRDVFVPLHDRVARARADRAELFLSIHADLLPDAALRGLSVYTLSDQASDREAAMLARQENREDFVGGLRLSRQPREIAAVLLDLARRRTNNQSLLLAHAVVEELGRIVPLLERPHRSAAFVVLTAPDIPSALVELGCLSNPQDERLLTQHAYQQRLALGLARAVDAYFAAGGTA